MNKKQREGLTQEGNHPFRFSLFQDSPRNQIIVIIILLLFAIFVTKFVSWFGEQDKVCLHWYEDNIKQTKCFKTAKEYNEFAQQKAFELAQRDTSLSLEFLSNVSLSSSSS
jgi:hypothetical protein